MRGKRNESDHHRLYGKRQNDGQPAFGPKLGCRAFDLDEYIVENERRSVKQIFEEDGEDYFRKREHELLLEILKEDAVLATGGGTPLREDNRLAMKMQGFR